MRGRKDRRKDDDDEREREREAAFHGGEKMSSNGEDERMMATMETYVFVYRRMFIYLNSRLRGVSISRIM